MSGGSDSRGLANFRLAQARALTGGLVIVYPADNELFIDLDTEEARVLFERQVGIFDQKLSCSHVVRPSPSGRPGRYHAVVTLSRPVRDAAERVYMQAILGSDPLREILSWLDLDSDHPSPTLFFERPPAQLTRGTT